MDLEKKKKKLVFIMKPNNLCIKDESIIRIMDSGFIYFRYFILFVMTALSCQPDEDISNSNNRVHLQIESTESALRIALDSISNQDGGKISFISDHDTIDISDRIYFYGNNLELDGNQQQIIFRYTGQDDCSQTEGQDHFIEIHGDNNKIINFTLIGFPDGIHIQSGIDNVVENIKFPYICEDAVTNSGRGYESFQTVIRNCYFESSEDKAVMINNGGSVLVEDCEFVNCAQPVRAGGKRGTHTVRNCVFNGTSTGPRFSGGAEGMLILFENNRVNDSKYGLRVYGSVQAIIRENYFENNSRNGIYIYDKARVSLEKNNFLSSGNIGILLEDSVLADLGGGEVSIDGKSITSGGENVLNGSRSKDLVNNTVFEVKAENNIWDHTTVTEVVANDIWGEIDVDPLYHNSAP
jgi:parallel beta-helix repeat protein